MKKNLLVALSICALFILGSCELTGTKPHIAINSGTNLVSSDVTLPKDTTVVFSVRAEKAEDVDVLKSFTLNRSINGGADSVLYSKALSGAEGDKFSYDQTIKVGNFNASKSGDVEKYTATVVNRDGLVNQVSVRITIK